MKINTVLVPAGKRLFAGAIVISSLAAVLSACHNKDKEEIPSLAILSFTPPEAWTGDTIKIGGTGFQIDKALNTVKFNGTVAIVTAATKDQLTVKIPAAATTGKVTVTVGNNTASSTQNFMINPGIMLSTDKAERGQTLSITGKGFDASTEVWLNGKKLTISSVAATLLEVVIPGDAVDGKVVVKKNGISQESATALHIFNYWTPFDAQTPPVGQFSYSKSFVYNNKIYLGFGDVYEGGWKSNDKIYSYNPATKNWQTEIIIPASIMIARKSPFVTVRGNQLYYGGGSSGAGSYNDCWAVDLTKSGENAWTKLPSLPVGSFSDPAFVLNDKVYAACEVNEHKVYQLDLAANGGAGSWVPVADINNDGWIIGGSFLMNNKAYFNDDTGGFYEFDPSQSPATFTKKTLTGDGAKHVGSMFAINENAYSIADNNYVYALDKAAGKWVKKSEVPRDGVGEPVVVNNRVFGIDIYGRVFEFIAQ